MGELPINSRRPSQERLINLQQPNRELPSEGLAWARVIHTHLLPIESHSFDRRLGNISTSGMITDPPRYLRPPIDTASYLPPLIPETVYIVPAL